MSVEFPIQGNRGEISRTPRRCVLPILRRDGALAFSVPSVFPLVFDPIPSTLCERGPAYLSARRCAPRRSRAVLATDFHANVPGDNYRSKGARWKTWGLLVYVGWPTLLRSDKC